MHLPVDTCIYIWIPIPAIQWLGAPPRKGVAVAKAKASEFDLYGKAVLRAAGRFLTRDKRNASKYIDAMRNVIVGGSGPRRFERIVRGDEQLFRLLWHGYNEIHESVVLLRDCPTLVRHYPRGSGRIPRSRVIRYHVGNYLNEMYILRERLSSYYKVVTRRYRGRISPVAKKVGDALLQSIFDALGDIGSTRGAHVHQSRYDDDRLDRLRALELVMNSSNADFVVGYYSHAVKDALAFWTQAIRRNNEQVEWALEAYFAFLRRIVFTKRGRMIDPAKERT